MKRFLPALVILCLGGGIGSAALGGVAADSVAGRRPYTELEIPIPSLTGSHARALGMGGAHIAVAEDASALTWNPAGLANVRRIELSTTLARADRRVETVWHGDGADRNVLETQLAGLHFLYPFPTYRGSLVVGFGIDRLRDYTLRYERSGMDDAVPLFGGRPGLLTDTHDREGKLAGYTAGVGWDVSPRLSFGVSVTHLRGSVYEELTFLREDVQDLSDTLALEDHFLDDYDLTGWTAAAGFLYRASSRVRFGGVIGAPRYLSTEGIEQRRFRDFYDDGSDASLLSEVLIEEDLTFPWWLGFGISLEGRGFIVAGDVRHTDYREIESKIGGEERFLRPYYRDGTSYAAGAEGLFPWFPLRVRAGYRYDPVPFNLTYCTADYCEEGAVDPDEVDVAYDQERRVVSAGGGYLFGGVLAIDFTVEASRYERVIEGADPSLYREKHATDDYLLSVSYRF